MAATVKPCSLRRERSCGQLSSRAHGTWKTVPMLTRTLRRYSGSPQRGETRTASTSSAAAERKIAPTLAGAAVCCEQARGIRCCGGQQDDSSVTAFSSSYKAFPLFAASLHLLCVQKTHGVRELPPAS